MSKPYMTRMGSKNEFYKDIVVDKETRNAINFYNLMCDLELQGKFKECRRQDQNKTK